MAEIENLEIRVGGAADGAIKAINRLISSMRRMQRAANSFTATNVVGEMNRIRSSADGAAQAMDAYAAAQQRANRAARGMRSSGAAKGFRDVGESANQATNAIAKMNDSWERFWQRMRSQSNRSQGFSGMSTPLLLAAPEPIETSFVDGEKGASAFESAIVSLKSKLPAVSAAVKDLGKSIGGGLVGALKAGTGGILGFMRGLTRIAKFRIYRTIVKDLGQSFKDLYGWSRAFGTDFAGSVDTIYTALRYLRNSIAALATPFVNVLAPAIDWVVDKIVAALNFINQFFAALSGASTYTVAKKVATTWESALDKTSKKAKDTADDIKRTILGFDEINKLVDNKDKSSSSGTGSSPYTEGYKAMFEEKALTGGFKGFSNAIQNALSDQISRINLILSGASLAVGAILAFSGANVPLGLAMIALGAAGVAKVVTENWNGLSADIKRVVGSIEGILTGAFLGVGAILAFSGVNVPLGIGLMALGVAGVAKSLVWGDLLTGGISNVLKNIVTIISGASLAVGAILAFSGVNIPLGIGLMAAGVTGISASLMWGGGISTSLTNVLKNILLIASGASLAVGLVLAFSGVNIPAGIAMIAAGVGGITASIIWGGALTGGVQNVIKNILLIVSGASLALGAILAFTGVNVPLGIGMIAAGAVGVAQSLVWGNTITSGISNVISSIGSLLGAAECVVGAILAFSGIKIGLGIGLMATGAATLFAASKVGSNAEIDGGAVTQKIKTALGTIEGVLLTGSLVFGTLFLLTGNIPLGIGLLASAGISALFGITEGTWDTSEILGKFTNFFTDLKTKINGWIEEIKGAWDDFMKFLGIEIDRTQYLIDWDGKPKYVTDGQTNKPQRSMGTGKGGGAQTGRNEYSFGRFDAAPAVSAFDKVKNKASSFATAFSTIIGGVKTTTDEMSQAVGLALDNLVSYFYYSEEDLAGMNWRPVGENAATTIRTGLGNTWWTVTGEMTKDMNNLYGTANSKSFNPIGEMVANTLNNGLNSNTWKAINTMTNLVWGMFNKKDEVPWITFGEEIPLDIQDGVNNYSQWAINTVTNFAWSMYNGMNGVSFKSIGEGIIKDVYNGFVNNTGWLADTLKNTAQGLFNIMSGKSAKIATSTTVSRTTTYSNATKPTKSARAKARGGIFRNGVWSSIPQYAGGTLNAGSLFWAGENGPEIVGRAGGRTEVLNKSQLASAMYSAVQAAMAPAAANFAAAAGNMAEAGGVDQEALETILGLIQRDSDAMARQNDLLRQQNEYLRSINDKEWTAELTTAAVQRALNRSNLRAGTTTVSVG